MRRSGDARERQMRRRGALKVEAQEQNSEAHARTPSPSRERVGVRVYRVCPIILPASSLTSFAATSAVMPDGSWQGLYSTTSAPTSTPGSV
jgi:hypothetical protein